MITLYLVRHGETTYNAEGRVQGHEDPPLTPLGLRQAEAIANRLASVNVNAIYSSDLIRASATADVIAARHGLPVFTTPLLREANLGVVQGLTRAEIEERFPAARHDWRAGFITARPPGAETIQQVIDRCARFLDGYLVQAADASSAVVVGHGGSLRGLIIAALGLPGETYQKLRFSNASLSIIEIGERRELRLMNDNCHCALPPANDKDVDSRT